MNVKDILKVPKAKFKNNEVVGSPVGDMIIVGVHSHIKTDGEWVVNYRLAFITKNGKINKNKNHRFFTEDRLTPL